VPAIFPRIVLRHWSREFMKHVFLKFFRAGGTFSEDAKTIE